MKKELLRIKDLTIEFDDIGRNNVAVNRFNMSMNESEVIGIVGESGSGKTMTAQAINGILKPNAIVSSGSIEFMGEELMSLPEPKKRRLCGANMGMIFQEPLTSLNPVYKIGRQVEEAVLLHTECSAAERKRQAIEMMGMVELPDPEKAYDMYPHQLSGGMRQRVMIAAALIHKPKLLIADEPTTALDVMVQAQLIRLLKRLNKSLNIGIIFISHNLLVVQRLCDRVIVMENSNIIEEGSTCEVFLHPKQEYTRELISAISACSLVK